MAEVVHRLHAAGTSAVLRVTLEPVVKTIYVLEGRPVYVDSDLRSETLGAYLVRAGRLSPEDHRLIIEKMRQTGRRQGELLIEAGLLGPHELYDALTEHQTEKVISCFAWQEGEFTVTEGRAWATSVLTLPMDPVRIVLEGVIRHHGPDRLEPPMGLPDRARPYPRPARRSPETMAGNALRHVHPLGSGQPGGHRDRLVARPRNSCRSLRPALPRFSSRSIGYVFLGGDGSSGRDEIPGAHVQAP